MKYKIEISEGCTAYYTLVNGVDINDLSEQQKTDFIDYLLQKLGEGLADNTVSLNTLIEAFQYHEYNADVNPCEQCGDFVTRTIWNI
jgi:hypothetical protein